MGEKYGFGWIVCTNRNFNSDERKKENKNKEYSKIEKVVLKFIHAT